MFLSIKFRAGVACVAVIQKKSGEEAFEFLAAYAALGGFVARSEHSTTTQYRQLRRLGRKMFKILGKWENKLLDLGGC